MSFIARFGGNAATNQSGLGSLNRALDAGLSARDINAYGVNFGPAAAAELARLSNTFIGKYGGNHRTNQAGLGSLDRALNAGMTIQQIQSQGINWGQAAQNKIAELTKPKAKPGSFIDKYGGDPGSNATGLESVKRAIDGNNMTINDIYGLSQSEGFSFGPKAQEAMDKYRDTYVGTYGGDIENNMTGLASVKRGEAAGMSIKAIQDQAGREGTTFGPLALDYFNQKREEAAQKVNPYNASTFVGENSLKIGNTNSGPKGKGGTSSFKRSKSGRNFGSSSSNAAMRINNQLTI